MSARPRKCLGCRTDIQFRYVCCGACWRALPAEIQIGFHSRIRDERGVALIKAAHWFKDNPPAVQR